MTGLFRADRWAVLELRASNEGLPFLSPSLWPFSILGRGARLSRIARIERPQFHRGGSASTRDGPAPQSLPNYTGHTLTFFAAAFSPSATLSERRQEKCRLHADSFAVTTRCGR